jgi:oxygen-independent coproporphyrinogen-3 oxidase
MTLPASGKDEVLNVSGVYIHIPFCDGKCSYCAFYSVPYEETLATAYIAALQKEMRFYEGVAPHTIYIGGGTPSILNIQQWNNLLLAIKKNFSLDKLVEWSVEVNPATRLDELLDIFLENGINRISVGVQSWQQDALNWLGRRHRVEDSVLTINAIKEKGIANFNIDIIAGIPALKLEDWQRDLEQTLQLDPPHVSVYMLTAEEGSKLVKAVKKKEKYLISEEEEITILQNTESFLKESGLRRYEISNYAKKDCECKHNCIYWKGEKYIGLGTAAASFLGNVRKVNDADILNYIRALKNNETPPCSEEKLSNLQIRLDKLVFGLRMMDGVSVALTAGFEKKIDELVKEGLLLIKENAFIILTERGKLLADYVARELFASANKLE